MIINKNKTLNMLRKLLFLVILITIVFIAKGQQIGNYLNKKIQEADGAGVPVVIILNNQWNSDSALMEFKSRKTIASQRIQSTVESVRKFTQKSQKSILSTIDDVKASYNISNIRPFWAANIIALKATGDAIHQLAMHPDVYEIVYDEPGYAIYPNEPTKTESSENPKGGALRGLKTIKAHKLWEVGHTGKGRLAFGVDTGVFPENPAFENRFMGNYFPLSQTWFGYNNNWPFDISSHGTHTLGTILGFKSPNNDTIGVAFGARFIASDPIVSNMNELRTRSELMESFQWALDPDNNPNTVSDVPDVISNSWGLTNTDNPENCNLPATLILNTVNAAGIAVVFSAGNDGPGSATIGEPAHISRSTTNVFSVGAIDALAMQIADFSSHGPTNCYSGSDTSLLIKPEVSAPGVSVYSCTGITSFGYMSGTSMAAPHVAGAVLLLKEAFPEAPGDEILMALYNTAIDMGTPGEDNTYGNGLIDCEAAFISLIGQYPLVLPNHNQINPYVVMHKRDFIEETEMIEIQAEVHCNQNNNFNILGFDLKINENSLEHTFTTSDNGNFIEVSIHIDPNDLPSGDKHLITGLINTDSETDDLIDNNFWFNIYNPQIHEIPYLVTFENSGYDFANSSIMPYNPDSYIGWRVDTISGFNVSKHAAKMNFYKYALMKKQKDFLLLPPLNISDYEDLSFSFKYAYAKRYDNIYKDSLLVVARYGTNFANSDTLFLNSGETLATLAENYSGTQFIPSTREQWKDTSISINHLIAHDLVKIEFIAINDNGNNLYIDNIAIHEGENPLLGIDNGKIAASVNIYPNPMRESITIESNDGVKGICIFDMSGRMVKQNKPAINNTTISINTSDLKPGIYIVQVQTQAGIINKKLIKH